MTGLDKITQRILDDAEDRARVLLEAAEADKRHIAETAEAEADAEEERITAHAEEEGNAITARARAAAAMDRRAKINAARGQVIDEAFEAARKELIGGDPARYRALLTALLTRALVEEAEAEERGMALGDDVEIPEHYEVILSPEDRERFGAALVADACRAAAPRIGAVRAARVKLAEGSANVGGGFLLRFGDIETNCTLAVLLAERRRALEGRVAELLFGAAEA